MGRILVNLKVGAGINSYFISFLIELQLPFLAAPFLYVASEDSLLDGILPVQSPNCQIPVI
jgi:hypothetical protein